MVTDADLKFLIENLNEKNEQNEKWDSVIEKGNDLLYYSAKCCKPKVIHPVLNLFRFWKSLHTYKF